MRRKAGISQPGSGGEAGPPLGAEPAPGRHQPMTGGADSQSWWRWDRPVTAVQSPAAEGRLARRAGGGEVGYCEVPWLPAGAAGLSAMGPERLWREAAAPEGRWLRGTRSPRSCRAHSAVEQEANRSAGRHASIWHRQEARNLAAPSEPRPEEAESPERMNSGPGRPATSGNLGSLENVLISIWLSLKQNSSPANLPKFSTRPRPHPCPPGHRQRGTYRRLGSPPPDPARRGHSWRPTGGLGARRRRNL
nr:uncharacterized protein LOC129533927 [Gorilla gorilla gorilla]